MYSHPVAGTPPAPPVPAERARALTRGARRFSFRAWLLRLRVARCAAEVRQCDELIRRECLLRAHWLRERSRAEIDLALARGSAP